MDKATGRLLGTGDIIRDPKLAKTFQTIAKDPFAFYNGSLAADIAHEVKAANGILTTDDLKNYRTKTPDTIRAVLPNSKFVVYGLRPPSSGVILSYMLRIMDGKPYFLRMTQSLRRSLFKFMSRVHRIERSYRGTNIFKANDLQTSPLGTENTRHAGKHKAT